MFIDADTIVRYLQSLYLISKVSYISPVGNKHIGGIVEDHVSVPSMEDWSNPLYIPVIIPIAQIDSYGDLAFKDSSWFLFMSEYTNNHPALMNLFKYDRLGLVFDFDILPVKRSLLFIFNYRTYKDWLDFLTKRQLIAIVDGPDGSLLNALTINIPADIAKEVQRWLSIRSRDN